MRLMRTAGAIVIGTMVIGCQGGGGGGGGGSHVSAPAGSTLTNADEQTAAELQRSYRASHPGQQVGYVNAVDPGRRVVSVAGIPPEMVREGAILSILTNGGGTLEAVVYARAAGYLQLRYPPLGPGQASPATGELAIWNPGGGAVIPDAVAPSPGPAPITSPGVNSPTGPVPPVTGNNSVPTTGNSSSAPAGGLGSGDLPMPSSPASRPPADVVPSTQPATARPTDDSPPPPPPISPATRPDLNK